MAAFSPPPPAVPPTPTLELPAQLSVAAAVAQICEHSDPLELVVVDGGKIIGRLRERDLLRLQAAGGELDALSVAAAMVPLAEGAATAEVANERGQWSEARLRAAIDAVPGFVSWIDGRGRYLGVNARLSAALKLPPEELVGREVGFLGNDTEFATFIDEFLASSDRQAQREVSARLGRHTRHYLLAACKHGSDVVAVGIDLTEWIERTGFPRDERPRSERVEVATAGGTRELQGALHSLEVELFERQQAAKQLLASEGQLRRVFEQAAVGIALLDSDGCICQINPSYCQLLGHARDELLGTLLFEWVSADRDDLQQGMYRLLARECAAFECELRYVRPDGTPAWFELTLSLVETVSRDEPLFAAIAFESGNRKATARAPS